MLFEPIRVRKSAEARRRAGCAKGYHLPIEAKHEREDGHKASNCRYCGAPIVRGIGRYWIFSGVMG